MSEKNGGTLKAKHTESYMQIPQGCCKEERDTVKKFSESSGDNITLTVVPTYPERPIP